MLSLLSAGMWGSGPTLVSDLLFHTGYTSTEQSPPGPVSLTITVKRDGSWTVTVGANDSLAGSPSSGRWGNSPDGTATVQFVVSNQLNSPTISNGASSPTALNVDRTIQVSKASANASCDVQVIVAVGSASVSDTTNITVNGA